MKVIVRPRQMGKTTDLIKYAAEIDATIVCLNEHMAKSIYRLAKDMGCNIHTPTPYTRLRCVSGTILIDNANMILANLLKYPEHMIGGVVLDGVPDVNYSQLKDGEQWEEFRKFNPDMTYNEFAKFKYGMKF